MGNRIFLSFIIPCYNMEAYIMECIDSLKKLQNAENAEFIFVNDGSIDGTLEIIRNFEQEDSRVVVIDQYNQGVSVSRNSAISIARGQYILCLDPDDYLSHDAIQTIKDKVKDADILIPNVTKQYGEKCYLVNHNIPDGFYSPTDFAKVCQKLPVAPKLVYKRAVIAKNQILFNNQVKCGEVMDFTISFLKHAKSVAVTSSSFYFYRMNREGQATQIPNYASDITILNTLYNYRDNKEVYSNFPSYIIIPFTLSLNFTYNKYIRLGLINDKVMENVKQVLSDPNFKFYRNLVIKKPGIQLKHKIQAMYLFLPANINYPLACYLYKILLMIKH